MTAHIALTSSNRVVLSVPLMLGYWPGPSLCLVVLDSDDGVDLILRCALLDDTATPMVPDTRASLRGSRSVGYYAVVTDPPPRLDLLAVTEVAEASFSGLPLLGTFVAARDGDDVLWRAVSREAAMGTSRHRMTAAEVEALRREWGLSAWRRSREDYVGDIRLRPELIASVSRHLAGMPSLQEASRDAAILACRQWLTGSTPIAARSVAEMLVALADTRVRDTLLWDLLRDPQADWAGAAQRLAQAVAVAPATHRAPVATLLGILRWQCGDGSRAWAAIDCAIDADPAYTLAELAARCLSGGMHPAVWLEGLSELSREDCRRSA